MKEHTSYLDTFLFPALFLYRQYLELSLKAIIRDGNILLGKPQKFLGKIDKKSVPPGKIEYDFPLGHDLVDLWATCNDILEQVDKIYPELKMFEKVDLAALGELFAEFSHEDPGSDAARYPVNLDNHPTFPNWKYLDMFHMKEIMGKIDAYFEGVSAAIMEYVSWQQDIASDYGY
jgi:hypothetical protein